MDKDISATQGQERGGNGDGECPSADTKGAQAEISLQHFGISNSDVVTMYSLRLSDGKECWVVPRRYSEFLRFHQELLERFGRSELPPFPPKEPLLQKIFGPDDKRSGWAEERRVSLQQYITALLQHPTTAQTPALLSFLNAPSQKARTVQRSATTSEASVLISGVRVRLTGDLGTVEVVVRAEASGPCRVRLALRPLQEDSIEEWQGHHDTSLDLLDDELSPMAFPWERWLEVDLPGGDACEATHRFELEPGSLWQVGAVGVNAAGVTGNVVCVQLRAPTAAEMVGIVHAGPSTGACAIDASAGQAGTESSACLDTPASVGLAGAVARTLEAEQTVALAPLAEEASTNGEEASKTAAADTANADEEAEASAEAEAQVSKTAAADTATADEEAEASAEAEAQVSKSAAADTATADEQEAEASAEAEVSKTAAADSAIADEEVEASAEAEAQVPRQRLLQEQTMAGRQGLRGDEVHQVMSYQGRAAAEYARRIEESARVSAEKAPHRFEKRGTGAIRSVAVKFSVARSAETEVQTNATSSSQAEERTLEVLDTHRQERQLLQLREDEMSAARWIHAVTGHAQMGSAAEGQCSLQEPLQSGEALCDLVNAVWPGRINGVYREGAQRYKHVANITLFLKALSDLGLDEGFLFAPTDLAEGKNLRPVVRCIMALAALVPEPPEYEGPRFEGADLAAPLSLRRGRGAGSGPNSVEGSTVGSAAGSAPGSSAGTPEKVENRERHSLGTDGNS